MRVRAEPGVLPRRQPPVHGLAARHRYSREGSTRGCPAGTRPPTLERAMIVGLVSDTHGFFDPRLNQVFDDCELILHAGDVGSEDVIEELRRIAPVQAVRGNVDPPASNLHLTLTLAVAGLTIHLLHILPPAHSDLAAWAESARSRALPQATRLLRAFDPSVDVVLFGHSHQPCLIELGKVLLVNPGSAGRRRFKLPRTCARLEISDDALDAQVIPLEPYDGVLPRAVRFERARKLS
jgi:putative phosphoesterase